MSRAKKATAKGIGWFEIAADDLERANKFYGELFGWKIKPLPGMTDYWHIDTGGGNKPSGGSLTARSRPEQTITNYVNVPSVTRYMAKVWKLGGRICSPRMIVPGRGCFAVCQDPENNTFALWEIKMKAK